MRTDPEARRRRRVVALVLAAALVAWGIYRVARSLAFVGPSVPALPDAARTAEPRPAPKVRVPAGVRVRVEVLNATPRTGLARRAMLHLRDAGFDVVRTGNARERPDSSVVIDRTGHPEWARLLAEAVGGARIEARPDSSGYVDLTVLLGAGYRPPTEPFYP